MKASRSHLPWTCDPSPPLLISLILLTLVSAAGAADISWTNIAGGNWNVAANWNPNVLPGSGDNVFIVSNGTYVVNFNVNATIKTLTLGSASGIQTLSNNANNLTVSTAGQINLNGVFILGGGILTGTNVVGGTLNWTGGSIDGNCTVLTGAVVNVSGGASKSFANVAFTNFGTLNVAGNISGGSYNFYNQPGGLFDLQGDLTISGFANAAFYNAGMLRKSAGAGTASFSPYLRNTGSVQAQSGTLSFGNGGNLGGTFTAAGGQAILLSGGNYTCDAMPVFSGNVTFGTFANIFFTVPISNFSFGSGILTGTNVVTGTLNWTGGSMGGNCTISNGAVVNVSGGASKSLGNGTYTNYGTVNLAADVGGGTYIFYNQPGGLFDIQGDVTLSGFANAAFYNAGVLRKSAGPGTASFGPSLINTATVQAQSGTLSFGNGGNLGGTFTASGGQAILFSGGTYTCDAMPVFSGNVTFGTFAVIYFTVPISNFTLSSGVLTGTNVITGTLAWTGGSMGGIWTVSTGAVINVSGVASKSLGNGTYTNYGTVNLAADLGGGTYTFFNQPGGIFDIQGDVTLSGFGNAAFNNAGLLRKSLGAGTTSFSPYLRNTGSVQVQNGTLSFGNGGNLGGTFTAAGGQAIVLSGGNYTCDAMPVFSGNVTFGTFANIFFTVPINNFALSSGVLTGTNVITGTLTWTGGSLGGNCTISTGAVVNVSGVASKSLGNGTYTNYGTLNLAADLGGGSYTVYNQPGGQFNIQGDVTISGFANAAFYNAGLLRKSAGVGTASFSPYLRNTGSVQVQSGTLSFGNGGNLGGTFTASGGQAISFSGGNYAFDTMPAFSGNVTFGTFANIYFTVPISNFVLDSGILTGTNVVLGTLTWTGGSIDGYCTVSTGAVVNISGGSTKSLAYVSFTNYGTVNLAANLGGSTYNFYIQPGGLFDIQGDVAITGFANAAFYNAGLLRKSGGVGTASFGPYLRNTGSVQVQSGTLSFGNGGNLGGMFTATGGQAISFSGGNYAFDTMPAFSGNVTFGTFANIYFTVPISNFTLNSGILTGTNVVTGILNWTGGNMDGYCTVLTGAVVNISGGNTKSFGYVALTNSGTVNLAADVGGLSFNFYNQPGGVFDIQGDVTVSGFANAAFYNAGLLRKSAGTGTALIAVNAWNTGTIWPLSGILAFSGSVNLSASGLIQFSIGGPTPGTQYGQVAVTGTFPLAGALNVSLTNGFTPGVGDIFRIINWGTRKGGFAAAGGLDLGNGLYFQGIADKAGLSLVTKSSVVPVPPPATNLVDQTVAPGDTAVFSLLAQGLEPFTFQWTFYGTNLLGQNASSLILANAQASNEGPYCVVIVDALLVTNTSCANLFVRTPPLITGQSGSVVTNAGSNVVFTVTASGSSPLQFQWRLNGQNIPGATNSSYTITNAQPRNGGTYSAVVANRVRAAVSTNAVLKINSPLLPFANNFAARGSTNSFGGVGSATNTTATYEIGEPYHAGKFGSNSVWLQWTAPAKGVATFNTRGSSFDTLLGIYQGTNGSPVVSNLTAVASDDDRADYFTSEAAFSAAAGTNYFIAVDGLAGARGNIVLTWNLDTNITQIPRIIQQPKDVTTALGAGATFNVFAASTTNLNYQWYFNDWLAVAGATTNTLTITNVGPLQLGVYSVEVTAITGESVASAGASLEIGPGVDAHSFDKLQDLLTTVSSNGGFHQFDLGSFPSVSAGTLGSQIINNFNSTTEQGEPVHSATIGGSSRWYLLTAASDGTMVLDTLGSDVATLLAVYVGNDIFSLTNVASDRSSAPDGVRSLVRFGAASGTRYLVAVDGVNGAQGNINLNWRLGTLPAYSGSFSSPKLQEGSSLLLQAGVTNGATSPKYQWRRNGANLAGATNSTYSLVGLQANQWGTYSVVVSNLVGAITNSVALVTLDIPLRLESESGNFRVVGTATQAVTVQLSSNLIVWAPIFTNVSPIIPVSFLDTNASKRPSGFYFLKSWP